MTSTERNFRQHQAILPRASTLASFLIGSFASGQGAETTANETEGRPSSEKSERLEEVVVTGQTVSLSSPKFTAPIVDTPKTIDVIPSEVIERQGVSSLRDALRNSPGITFQAGEGGGAPGDNLFIRGFSARTDIFVDGVRDSGDFSRDMFNVEQVEVIKGPGSSYTGRGSTGGSVNQATKKAQATSFVQANVEVGTADHYRGTVDVNRKLDRDGNSALRINLVGEDSGVPGRDEIFNRTAGAAIAYTYGLKKPTQIAFNYQHLEQDNLPSYGLWRDALTDPNYDWSKFYGLTERDYEDITSDTVGLEITHKVSENFSLRNYTRVGQNTRDAGVTSPRIGTVNGVTVARRNDFKMQDRRNTTLANQTDFFYDFGSETIRHSLLAGIELSRERYENYRKAVKDLPAGADPLFPTDLYNPNPDDPWGGTIYRTGSYEDGVGKTIAGYLSDRIEMGNHWEINGGLRWERFSAHVDDVDYDSGTDTTTRNQLSQVVKMLSWNAGLVFKPTDSGSIYISYGTSFNPSAESLTLSRTGRGGSTPLDGNPDLKTEKNRSYELGTKWELLNQKLFLSAALFRTVKENDYEYGVDGVTPVLAGDRTVDGIELSLSGNITPRWYVYGGFVKMDSKAESNAGDPDEELAYTPSESFNLWTTFEITKQLTIGGGSQYTGDYYYRNSSDPTTIPPQASYWLFNAMVEYEVNKNLTLRLNVDNLTDEQYVERGYPGHFSPGPGRAATLMAAFQF